jgi:LacI family transcriptional regulator
VIDAPMLADDNTSACSHEWEQSRDPQKGAASLRHTLKDVATHAGVSVGTVSRVLNDNPTVSPEMRARVEAAIDALGYRPNALARNFRRQQSHTLGLVVPDITAPFFAELAKHIGGAARQSGYGVLLGDSEYSQEAERMFLQTLTDRRVDGLILVPTSPVNPVPKTERERVVVVDRELPGMDLVAGDHAAGAARATQCLLDLGHEVIAFIAGPQELPPLKLRYKAYVRTVSSTFSELGLELDEYVRTGPFVYEFGYEAAVSLLEECDPQPTALVASSDQQAIGALRACADLGIDVPRDLSIIGFDDIPLANLVTPRLTTVRQPLEELSRVAVARLLQRLEAPPTRPRRVLLPTELITRASCGPPRRGAIEITNLDELGPPFRN